VEATMSIKEFTSEELEVSHVRLPLLDDDDDEQATTAYDEARKAAEAYGHDPAVLFTHTRSKSVRAARVALWRALRALGWSLTEIGNYTGHDHTTVLYALSEERRLKRVAKYRAKYLAGKGQP
jgi:chromosomal replication initiation ATPase DnaA